MAKRPPRRPNGKAQREARAAANRGAHEAAYKQKQAEARANNRPLPVPRPNDAEPLTWQREAWRMFTLGELPKAAEAASKAVELLRFSDLDHRFYLAAKGLRERIERKQRKGEQWNTGSQGLL